MDSSFLLAPLHLIWPSHTLLSSPLVTWQFSFTAGGTLFDCLQDSQLEGSSGNLELIGAKSEQGTGTVLLFENVSLLWNFSITIPNMVWECHWDHHQPSSHLHHHLAIFTTTWPSLAWPGHLYHHATIRKILGKKSVIYAIVFKSHILSSLFNEIAPARSLGASLKSWSLLLYQACGSISATHKSLAVSSLLCFLGHFSLAWPVDNKVHRYPSLLASYDFSLSDPILSQVLRCRWPYINSHLYLPLVLKFFDWGFCLEV